MLCGKIMMCEKIIQTIIVAVQATKHESELFLVHAQILCELLKVQLAVMIGVTHTYNLRGGGSEKCTFKATNVRFGGAICELYLTVAM